MQSDDPIRLTSGHIRAARALLRLSAEDLASASRLGLATIRRAEATDGPLRMTAANEAALRAALEEAGIEFLDGGRPGVRMRAKR